MGLIRIPTGRAPIYCSFCEQQPPAAIVIAFTT
jgi:hypothetical protein